MFLQAGILLHIWLQEVAGVASFEFASNFVTNWLAQLIS